MFMWSFGPLLYDSGSIPQFRAVGRSERCSSRVADSQGTLVGTFNQGPWYFNGVSYGLRGIQGLCLGYIRLWAWGDLPEISLKEVDRSILAGARHVETAGACGRSKGAVTWRLMGLLTSYF